MFGIREGGGYLDIFIRLRFTGPDDEKNIAAFALREHRADFSSAGEVS